MPFIFDPDKGGGERPAAWRRRLAGSAFLRTLVYLAVTALTGLLYFYLALPPLNLRSPEFYFFIFFLCIVYCGCAVLLSGFFSSSAGDYLRFVKKQCSLPFFIVLALLAVAAIGTLSSWVALRSKAYSELLPLDTGDFTAEVEEIRYDQIPMLDKDSASRLGSRKLGELADMVSQFEILPYYTQINYRGRPVRVSPLAYGDLVKWFTNRSQGLPAYLIIDMVTQEADVVRLPQGMKYSPADHFSRNLYRHLRFQFPTMLFDEPVFEIDEEGTPYWVCARIVRRIGLFGGTDIQGAVLIDAVTGESTYYEDVPTWVDRLYSSDIIMAQYDYYGLYHNGFFNAYFGQRDVTLTTDGWNYIAMDDDVYMYTGVTSATSDQSNIGFILSNQRTKETRFYPCAGATENSAQASAQSQVQQMRYTATFPLLLNIAHQPTYFMSLKGDDGLVKMYAMVNVQQYNIVKTGQTLAECEENYRQALVQNGIIQDTAPTEPVPDPGSVEVHGTIAEIRSAVIGGNSVYYLRFEGDSAFTVAASALDVPIAPLLTVGDGITALCAPGEPCLTASRIVVESAAAPAEGQEAA